MPAADCKFVSQRLIQKKIARYQNIDCEFIKFLIFWWQPAADCECVSQRLRPEAGFLLKEAALGILCPSKWVTLIVEFRN